jgi:hypothetical protein
MVADHGPDALTTAKKRALVLRAEGFESLAKTWDLISAVLQDVDDLKDKSPAEEVRAATGGARSASDDPGPWPAPLQGLGG